MRAFVPRVSPSSDRTASAVCADAPTVAESSRDVSDPTRGPLTLTPGLVRGSLTSRLLVPRAVLKSDTNSPTNACLIRR